VDAELLQPLKLFLNIVDEEHGCRDTLFEDGVLVCSCGGVGVWLENKLGPVRILCRNDCQPSVAAGADVCFLDET
jgi:hypothetical protein